jgi:hypothetical protein
MCASVRLVTCQKSFVACILIEIEKGLVARTGHNFIGERKISLKKLRF